MSKMKFHLYSRPETLPRRGGRAVYCVKVSRAEASRVCALDNFGEGGKSGAAAVDRWSEHDNSLSWRDNIEVDVNGERHRSATHLKILPCASVGLLWQNSTTILVGWNILPLRVFLWIEISHPDVCPAPPIQLNIILHGISSAIEIGLTREGGKKVTPPRR